MGLHARGAQKGVLLNLRFAHENDNQKGASGQLINHYLNLFSSTLLTFYTLPNIA